MARIATSWAMLAEKGVVGKSYSQIEEIIGEELSCGAKAFDHF